MTRRLLVLLLAGVAMLGALAAGVSRDLVQHRVSVAQASEPVYMRYKAPDGANTQFAVYVALPERMERVSRVFWAALPSAILVLGLLGLMLSIAILARRRGLYARATLRLIRITGFAALVGGPVAAAIEAAGGSGTKALAWPAVALLALLGAALLAVREVLGRAGELRDELEGVI